MDPNSNLTMPNPELPPPRPETEAVGQMPSVEQMPEVRPASAETAGVQAELPPAPAAQSGLPMPIPTMQIPDPAAVAQPQPSALPVTDLPDIAEDNDLIEQEWVDKAKEIVERTKSDPHTQNKEINKVKADYIRKRYNREIKVSEA